MTETDLQHAIRLALGRTPGLVLFRNNVGVARYGNQTVRYGLSPGSSDLIGCYNGRFVALEVKTPRGRTSREQQAFVSLIRKLGGFAAVVRSVDDASAAIQRCSEGACE